MFQQIRLDAFQQAYAKFLVGHFAAAEAQGNLRFVAFMQELDQVAQLDLVIAFIGTRPEFYLLDLNLLLLELGIMCPLGFLVLELAEIHQATYWRLRGGRNFYQIHTFFFSESEPGIQRHDPKLFGIQPNQTNLGGVNLIVDAVRLL
jgi:hypothetical protein